MLFDLVSVFRREVEVARLFWELFLVVVVLLFPYFGDDIISRFLWTWQMWAQTRCFKSDHLPLVRPDHLFSQVRSLFLFNTVVQFLTLCRFIILLTCFFFLLSTLLCISVTQSFNQVWFSISFRNSSGSERDTQGSRFLSNRSFFTSWSVRIHPDHPVSSKVRLNLLLFRSSIDLDVKWKLLR